MAKPYFLTLLGAAPFFVVWTLLDMWRLRRPMRVLGAYPAHAGLDHDEARRDVARLGCKREPLAGGFRDQ
jgi:hypothetical protein